jgi:hypothetical protein
LSTEGLVVPLEEDAASPDSTNRQPLPEPSGFEPPVLEKFTDMQDLILLDPVHEVDERGWPHVPRNP